MKFFFSNVLERKLYTWIRVFLPPMFPKKFKNSFFSEHFRKVVLTIWPDQFSHAFTRHNAFIAVFAFHFS